MLQRRGLILVYHRVAELANDPWCLAVTPEHFAEHLHVLRRQYQPMRLQQFVDRLHKGTLPRRAVAVTFDDGYADIATHAAPMLEQHQVPATFFLVSGMLGSTREFWWDELDRLLLQPGTLPATLRLTICSCEHTWSLGHAAQYSAEHAHNLRAWRTPEPPPTARHALYLELWKLLHGLTHAAREQVLEELRAWARREPTGRPSHRTLLPHEAQALAQHALFEVGAHTVTHPSLAALPLDQQRDEVQHSKAQLESLIGRLVTSFSYPYGKPHDYSADTVTLVQHAGFAHACTNTGGVVRQATRPYLLPRMYVRDWDGSRFAAVLANWFRPLRAVS